MSAESFRQTHFLSVPRGLFGRVVVAGVLPFFGPDLPDVLHRFAAPIGTRRVVGLAG